MYVLLCPKVDHFQTGQGHLVSLEREVKKVKRVLRDSLYLDPLEEMVSRVPRGCLAHQVLQAKQVGKALSCFSQ